MRIRPVSARWVARSQRSALAAFTPWLVGLAVSPTAAGARGPSLILDGAQRSVVELCGAPRNAIAVSEDVRVVARVTRRGRKTASLTVEHCRADTWTNRQRITLGRARTGVLDTSVVGDYRIRGRSGGRRSRAVYLRVGVGEIADTAIRLTLANVNRSRLACSTDGRRYTIVGHLTAPRAVLLASRPAVTLWVHGGETSGDYLRLPVPGYDMAYELARLGHASVIFDRLGHGVSDAPAGAGSCIGGQADMAHQLVGALRAGTYATAKPERPTAFVRIALAGHSFGGPIAEYEAGSFQDVDALIVSDASFGNPGSSLLTAILAGESPSCLAGGHPKRDGGPPAYAYVWPNDDRYKADVFYDAEPTVMDALAGRRERNPCGDLESVPPAILGEEAITARVNAPVLLVFADHDAVFPPPAGERQREFFTGSRDVTLVTIPGAGHAVMLERQAPVFRSEVSRWLTARGF